MYLENKKKNRFASESSWALPVQSDQLFSLHRFFSLDWCFIWSLQQTENTKAILVQCITALLLLKKTKIKCSSENYFPSDYFNTISQLVVRTTIWTMRLGLNTWHSISLTQILPYFLTQLFVSGFDSIFCTNGKLDIVFLTIETCKTLSPEVQMLCFHHTKKNKVKRSIIMRYIWN